MRRASWKARACWRLSTACWRGRDLRASSIALRRRLGRSRCGLRARGIRCSKSGCGRQAGQIVPLRLELTADERQLIISGPNTGGKTVALKTTALLAMMAQAGIPVPADAGELSGFHGVPG